MRSFRRSTHALLFILAGVTGFFGAQTRPAAAEGTVTYSIGGKALTPEGAGIGGVTIKIDGTTKTTLTSDTGDYLFPTLPAGTYTLLASKTGYDFDPASRAVTLPTTEGEFAPNGRARFVGKPKPVALSVAGLIKTSAGVAIGGVDVALMPTATTGTTLHALTDSTGRYRFDNVPKGGYVVKPKKEHFLFAPADASITLPTTGLEFSPNARANFVGAEVQDDLKVFGKVTTAAGVAVPGVKLFNTTAITDTIVPVAVTNSEGRYVWEHLKAGKYYLIPRAPGFTFTPAAGVVEIPTTGLEWSPNGRILFTATAVVPTKFGIRGKILNAKGFPMAGVSVRLGSTDRVVTTDTNGEYRIGDLPAGEYSVAPSKTNFTFTPASKTVTLPTTGDPNSPGATANFYGKENEVKYFIAGKVVNGSGVALAGVTLSLGTSGVTATTGTTGEYKFDGLAAGTYVVTPSKTNFTFTPAHASVTLPTTGTTAPNGKADFKGVENSTVKYSIYCKIKVSSTLAALPGVTAKLNDGTTVLATSNAEGALVITNLPAGSYVVHLSLDGYVFTPATPTVTFPLTTGETYKLFEVYAAPVVK